ncbi:FadR/GntR family transcriptional regulator [Tessaracoccus palaemonis]|uniref:FCD domain-containing protein n=1 Tax=Tessaracoccus palaemonis TaxID=2829499 RepID=A0ABX8SP30_9ACTN|nr:FCD domain-containing protein [Tessaracoccus palaemonis]QXT64155.1 FCD domain-containing protein [Tessaracoccus palaemonis]
MATRTRGTARSQAVLRYLRQKIVSGEWPVNSKIPTEPELMDLLGVGRTTVRESVRTLANLGMLETMVSRGTFVRSQLPVSSVLAEFMAEYELTDVLGFRRALEVDAAWLAAQHRTPEQLESLRQAVAADTDEADEAVERGETPGSFHHTLLETTGNPLMIAVYGGAMAGLRERLSADVTRETPEQRRADHAEILAAIEAQDAPAAAEAMIRHAKRDLVLPE